MIMSGGSRGIGLAIGIAAGHLGANVVLLAKTDQPHPKLAGTVHTAAAEIEAAGGKAAAVVGDVRNDDDVRRAVKVAVETFGGVDICVNNASAISTEPTETLAVKKFDLMADINIKGTFLLTQACLPDLRESANPHVLTIAPPLNMNPRWLGAHPVYTLSKYGMSLLSLGWAAEFADAGIAFNCLWPQTYIATAAVANSPDGEKQLAASRSPEIMADAAVEILSRPSREATGGCYIDEDVLVAAGGYDLSRYGGGPHPIVDLFIG
jgi:NAD(P)-dependent dehydrogenase (short-subunit alcohol dehydrogenase family)